MHGIVKDMKVTTISGTVNTDEGTTQIVPIDDKLLVEAYTHPRDIAFIRTGQPALVKINAYGYSIYDGLEGKVTLVDAGTVSNSTQNRASDLRLGPSQVYYRALIQAENNSLKDKNGKPIPIIPSMVVTVDIRTGGGIILQYLIKPITRMKQALSEC